MVYYNRLGFEVYVKSFQLQVRAVEAQVPFSVSNGLVSWLWNRLLNTMFPPGRHSIRSCPQFPVKDRDFVNFVVTLLIHVNAILFFFVEVEPLADVSTPSKRERANLQMRQRFLDCRQNLMVDTLHGVSAFSTKLVLYQVDEATDVSNPV